MYHLFLFTHHYKNQGCCFFLFFSFSECLFTVFVTAFLSRIGHHREIHRMNFLRLVLNHSSIAKDLVFMKKIHHYTFNAFAGTQNSKHLLYMEKHKLSLVAKSVYSSAAIVIRMRLRADLFVTGPAPAAMVEHISKYGWKYYVFKI